MKSTWIKIKPYGAGSDTVYWINGIYKITSYGSKRYNAYYIPDHYKNWGDYVCPPPSVDGDGRRYWPTLESAKKDCEKHSLKHTPKAGTILSAEQSKNGYLETEKENLALINQ